MIIIDGRCLAKVICDDRISIDETETLSMKIVECVSVRSVLWKFIMYNQQNKRKIFKNERLVKMFV